jgi:5-methylcytosine-specific restriction endonuclease McrA
MRRIFRWSPERRAALAIAEVAKERYRCAGCSAIVDRKSAAADHIDPVVDISRGFEGWDSYAARLFCQRSGLQVLCKACHSAKTKAENVERKKWKKIRESRTAADVEKTPPLE